MTPEWAAALALLAESLAWEVNHSAASIEPCLFACDNTRIRLTGVAKGESEFALTTPAFEQRLKLNIH